MTARPRAQEWGTYRLRERDGLPMEESIVLAERDLVDALAGLEIADQDMWAVDWLMGWEPHVIRSMATIVRTARAAGPQSATPS